MSQLRFHVLQTRQPVYWAESTQRHCVLAYPEKGGSLNAHRSKPVKPRTDATTSGIECTTRPVVNEQPMGAGWKHILAQVEATAIQSTSG
eukprot:244581-Amphidinium_carterae.1